MYGWWYLFIVFILMIIIGIVLEILYYEDKVAEFCCGLGAVFILAGAIMGIISLFIAVFVPLKAIDQTTQMQELYPTYCYYAELIQSNDTFDGNFAQNAAYMDAITSYNTWLAEAKASQDTYGCFSKYFNVDLNQLQYINIFN